MYKSEPISPSCLYIAGSDVYIVHRYTLSRIQDAHAIVYILCAGIALWSIATHWIERSCRLNIAWQNVHSTYLEVVITRWIQHAERESRTKTHLLQHFQRLCFWLIYQLWTTITRYCLIRQCSHGSTVVTWRDITLYYGVHVEIGWKFSRISRVWAWLWKLYQSS